MPLGETMHGDGDGDGDGDGGCETRQSSYVYAWKIVHAAGLLDRSQPRPLPDQAHRQPSSW